MKYRTTMKMPMVPANRTRKGMTQAMVSSVSVTMVGCSRRATAMTAKERAARPQ